MVWEERETNNLIKLYEELQDPHKVGKEMNISYRSVIGKLVSLQLYNPPKEEKREPTVKQMVRDIEEYFGIEFETENMNKKENVKKIWEWCKEDEQN